MLPKEWKKEQDLFFAEKFITKIGNMLLYLFFLLATGHILNFLMEV